MAMLGQRPFTPNPVNMPVSPMGAVPDALAPSLPALPAVAPKHTNWLGILADALSGAAGQPGMYAQRMTQEKQLQEQRDYLQQQHDQARTESQSDLQTRFAQQMALEAWKEQHRTDPLTQAMTAAGIDPHSPQGMALYGKRAQAIADPPRFVTSNGQVFEVGGGNGGDAAPPAPQVGEIRNGYRYNGGDPSNQNNWIKAGGPTQHASGNFL